MTDAERKKLRAAGYSTAEINQIERSQGQSGQMSTPVNKVWLPGKKSKRIASSGYSPSFGGVDTGMVGPTPTTYKTHHTGRGPKSSDEVFNWVYNDKRRGQIMRYLSKRGIEVNDPADLERIWGEAVKRATTAYMGSRVKKSPWDMIDDFVTPGNSGTGPSAAEQAFPWRGKAFSETTTSIQIAELGPEVAQQILERSLTEFLGRAPRQDEIEDFAARANAIVHENPIKTRNTAQMVWDPNLNGPGMGGYKQTSSTSKQVGRSGEEVQAMVENEAEDEAMENPEYGAYQAATTYFNALLSAIESPV